MEADKELIEYIAERYKLKKEQEEKHKPHGDDRFKHILAMGEASAYKDILMALGISV